jgi:hypothetical protein
VDVRGNPGFDQYVYAHSNCTCVLGITRWHALVTRGSPVEAVRFTLGKDSVEDVKVCAQTRATPTGEGSLRGACGTRCKPLSCFSFVMQVSGKCKHGSVTVGEQSMILEATTADGTVYPVYW